VSIYVVIDTGIGAIFFERKKRVKNNIWHGNELSEYDTVQSTVLVDGRRYLTVVHRLIAVSFGGIRHSGNYDAGVTCVSRVIISCLH